MRVRSRIRRASRNTFVSFTIERTDAATRYRAVGAAAQFNRPSFSRVESSAGKTFTTSQVPESRIIASQTGVPSTGADFRHLFARSKEFFCICRFVGQWKSNLETSGNLGQHFFFPSVTMCVFHVRITGLTWKATPFLLRKLNLGYQLVSCARCLGRMSITWLENLTASCFKEHPMQQLMPAVTFPACALTNVL